VKQLRLNVAVTIDYRFVLAVLFGLVLLLATVLLLNNKY
jgi:hypothetical protein